VIDADLQQRLELFEELRRLRGQEAGQWAADTHFRISRSSQFYPVTPSTPAADSRSPSARRLADTRLEVQLAIERARELWHAVPALWEGDAAPIVLLPVRLETRIEPGPPARLLLRIYPDDVHIDAHDNALTELELAAGARFWAAVWAAGPNGERRAAAWEELGRSVRPARARWIAERLRPAAAPPAHETPIGTPGPLPDLPTDVETRPGSWARPARTLLLPRRFCAFGFHGGEYRWHELGESVDDELAVSPYPRPDQRFFDGAGRWLVDFDAAVAAGMALVKELPDGAPLDRIVVVGVDDGIDAAGGAARLADALTRHGYEAGLGLLPPGTPTNNTLQTRSAWAGEPDVPSPLEPAPAPEPEADGARLAGALGIDPPVLAAIPAADGSYDRDAATVQRLLWPALGGKLLLAPYPGRLSGPPLWIATAVPRAATPEMVAALHDHVTRFLRSAGPWPTLRVGVQPYGVLPATSLLLWGGDEHVESRLVEIAQLIRDWVVRFAGRTPRRGLPRQVSDFDRKAFGLAPPPEGAGEAVRDQALIDVLCQRAWSDTAWVRGYASAFGANAFWDVLCLAPKAATESAAEPVTVPLTPPGGFSAQLRTWMTRYGPDDIAAFLTDLDGVAAGSTKLAAVTAAWLARHPGDRTAVLPDEVPRFAPFGASVPGLSDPPADLLSALVLDAHLVSRLSPEHAAGLQRLAAIDPARLPLLTGGMFDLCSHRYDAWITSIATARLSRMRAAGTTGVHIGAYGWVDEFDTGPPDPPTWIHAPSMQHATTAAVLRAGYDAAREQALAVDLTSRRVRRAEWLLGGVRNGQPLGALAGYLVERELHDRGLDVAIDALRTLAPGPSSEGTVGDGERVPGRVCDGLRLARLFWSRGPGLVDVVAGALQQLGLGTSPAAGAIDRIVDCVRIAADAVDATGDLLLAESVHHAVGGNPLRAGVAADVMAGGATDVPDGFDVVRTPRSGVPVGHRIGVLLPVGITSAGGSGWAAGRPRAALAPEVDAWCGLLLGPPGRWRFRCLDGADPSARSVGLDDVALCPLDVIFETGGDHPPLERRLLAAAGADVRLDPADSAFGELSALTTLVRAVLGRARDVQPEDGATPAGSEALDQRVTTALTAVAAALRRPDLAALANLGVIEAFPVAVGPEAAATQAGLLVGTLLPMVDAALASAERTVRLGALRRVLGEAFPLFATVTMPGEQLAALADPTRPDAGDEPAEAIAAWVGDVAGVRDGVADWERLALLSDALGGADVFGGSQLLQLPLTGADAWAAGAWQPRTPGGATAGAWHVPFPLAGAGALTGFVVDRWTEVVPGQLVRQGTASAAFVPEETTAVAFSFDQPDSRPPQAILVAVPPDPAAGWRIETVFEVVRETLDLARLRMIDLPAFGGGLNLVPLTSTFDVAAATGLPFMTGLLAHMTTGDPVP
jgi:hypothetical protein